MTTKRLLAVLILVGVSIVAVAKPYYVREDVAVSGYDTVAYFTESKPVVGNKDISTQWDGATWYFSSFEHRGLFVADPTAYAPQYGGWCSYAMSKGRRAMADPMAWDIVDDKLYLNFSLEVREEWRENIPRRIKAANKHWRKYKQ